MLVSLQNEITSLVSKTLKKISTYFVKTQKIFKKGGKATRSMVIWAFLNKIVTLTGASGVFNNFFPEFKNFLSAEKNFQNF